MMAARVEDFRPLDRYAGGLSDERARVPWLATISLGRLDSTRKPPIPVVSRQSDERWIHMTEQDRERAPGLWKALDGGKFRSLDIALPFDAVADFLQQHFEKRSATRLEAFGDQYELTEILPNAERRIYPAGSIEYKRLVRECNVSGSFFFCLQRWEGRESRMYWPESDGLGVYRVRFTSRHSLREILAVAKQLAALTGGRLSGLPLRLTIDWRDVADPTGQRRTIPVWRPRFMPPVGLELTPAIWQDLAAAGLAEGQLLRLPAPTIESAADAAEVVDVDLDEPNEQAVQAVREGRPLCDAAFWQGAWFARVKGSTFDSDDARAQFLSAYTGGRFESLTDFLAQASEAEAAALVADVAELVARERIKVNADKYQAIFGLEDEPIVLNAQGKRVQKATGEVLDDEVQDAPVAGPVRAPDPPAVTVNSALGQRLAELVEEAARLEVDYDDCMASLPAPREEVIRKIERLEDRIERKKRRLAGLEQANLV